ncbi:hypothetical protein B0H14DRAFT_2575884 [Mycena olivaceomarginata]|nr:hypothetical protein B0H14DRAFT_2575884 [Mycena olivaceomarginata]
MRAAPPHSHHHQYHCELPPVSMGHSVDEFFGHLAESLYCQTGRGDCILRNFAARPLAFSLHTRSLADAIWDTARRHARGEEAIPVPEADAERCVGAGNRANELRSGMVEKLYAQVREAGQKMLDDALEVILGSHTRLSGAVSVTKLASTKLNSRSFFRFDVRVDLRQQHEFLECASLATYASVIPHLVSSRDAQPPGPSDFYSPGKDIRPSLVQ